MKIFNIMMSRGVDNIYQSFLSYRSFLKKEGGEIIDITSSYALVNSKLLKSLKLPNLFHCCIFSKVYLRVLIAAYKPDILLAHGERAISFACAFKPLSLPLVGITYSFGSNLFERCNDLFSVSNTLMYYLYHCGEINNSFYINTVNANYICKEVKIYNEPLIIGGVGCFIAKNSLNYLIEAVSLLKTQGYNIKLLVAEAGEERPLLQELVNRLNLFNEVSFLENIGNVKKFLRKIDIFCLPCASSKSVNSILIEIIKNSALMMLRLIKKEKKLF